MSSAAVKVSPVDWISILDELKQLQSYGEIASGCGLAKTLIIGLARGDNRPGHANGEQLIAYWCTTTGKSRDRLPYEFG